jgi:hypothetical protein
VNKCKYIKAWISACGKACGKNEYCKEHSKAKCCSCGGKATNECGETGQFVCGAPLCDNCEHTIAENGTNGIGFYLVSNYPTGYGAHCKKKRTDI